MSKLDYYKICPECNEHFDATRLNQKFCDLVCKTRFNNRNIRTRRQTQIQDDSITKDINTILLKNRTILKKFEGKTVTLDVMTKLGFVKKYVTQFELVSNIKTIFFCYDMGYEFVDKYNLTIFKRT